MADLISSCALAESRTIFSKAALSSVMPAAWVATAPTKVPRAESAVPCNVETLLERNPTLIESHWLLTVASRRLK